LWFISLPAADMHPYIKYPHFTTNTKLYSNKDQSSFAKGKTTLTSPLNSSFVSTSWQHRIDSCWCIIDDSNDRQRNVWERVKSVALQDAPTQNLLKPLLASGLEVNLDGSFDMPTCCHYTVSDCDYSDN